MPNPLVVAWKELFSFSIAVVSFQIGIYTFL